MIAREWKCLCPTRQRQGFLEHLNRTGVRESHDTPGYLGHQVLERRAIACQAGRSRMTPKCRTGTFSPSTALVDMCPTSDGDRWATIWWP